MYDIVENVPEVIAKCKEQHITPLIIGVDVELVDTAVKTSNALITLATSSEREILESAIDAITDIEHAKKNDFLHHRNSGLDQVQAHILAKRQNAYIVNLNSFRKAKNKPLLLGRIQQNLRIAKKFGIPVLFASFAQTPQELPTIHDHKAFWRALGTDTKQLRYAQHSFETLIQRSKTRSNPGYVAEGIQKL